VQSRTDKIGFATPEAQWLRGPLGAFASDVLGDRRCRERGFIDANAAQAQLRRVRDGGASGLPLWRAVSLELWARAFLDG
jgi:asparagine synthase (glutamine-hydrolysing)